MFFLANTFVLFSFFSHCIILYNSCSLNDDTMILVHWYITWIHWSLFFFEQMTTNYSERKLPIDGSGRRRKNIDLQSPCYVRVLIFSSRVFFLFVLSLKCVKVIEASTFFFLQINIRKRYIVAFIHTANKRKKWVFLPHQHLRLVLLQIHIWVYWENRVVRLVH
jgi:hypothetical protein